MADPNLIFDIYNADGSAFHGLKLKKSTYTSTVMSLDDKIEGNVLYADETLVFTFKEYVMYNGVKYSLRIDNPPTILKKGMTKDNNELGGMAKYSLTFYHPSSALYNIPFTDVAVSADEKKYKSEDTDFYWIGTLTDLAAKIDKNLESTLWHCSLQTGYVDSGKQSQVLQFANQKISDVLKTAYDEFKIPFVVDGYNIYFGAPVNEVLIEGTSTPYVFEFGQGLGLKNSDRTPRNNEVITRIAGYGLETNIPYGYPKIQWTGIDAEADWDYTINNDPNNVDSYPIIDGVIDGVNVRLINHPFTRKVLMPTIYVDNVNKKVNPKAVGYDPDTVLVDYYDAISDVDRTYPTPINPLSPSYTKKEFDVKPTIENATYQSQAIDVIKSISWINDDLTPASGVDDTFDSNTGKYKQEYFKIELYPLGFDLYAMAAVTSAMSINIKSGDCSGCTFEINADWDVVKNNFYDANGMFAPQGTQRDLILFPISTDASISVIVKKDTNTFGTVYPNIYQQPIANDKFVFLGIDMPSIYISDKQTVLDNLMKDDMLENNIPYYEYPLDFDEYFLTNNQYILNQIKTNCVIRSEYAGTSLALYVKELSVSWGNNPLPTYKISLTDNIEVVSNAIGQVVEGLNKLETQTSSAVSGATSGSFSRNVSIGGRLDVAGKTTLHALEATTGEFTDDIHTTGKVIGDSGVFAGGIGDLYESGGIGFTEVVEEKVGNSNVVTGGHKNGSDVVLEMGLEVYSKAEVYNMTETAALLNTDFISEGTPKFVHYPTLAEGKYLRDNGVWSEVTAGGGSSAADIYLTNVNSTITGYKTLSTLNDVSSTTFSYTQSGVGEHLLATFIYAIGVGTTVIDAGNWLFNHYSRASATAGNPYLRFEVFKRDISGVETTLFTKNTITLSTVYTQRITTDWQPSFTVLATDKIGLRIYVVSGVAASITFDLQVGDSTVSYINTPLALRHTQLRGLNDDTGFLHMTLTEKNDIDACIGALSGQVLSLQAKNQYDELYAEYINARTISADLFVGALVGNASTATKLAATKTINGTAFDGSADITTLKWGTARTLTIGSKGYSVDGSDAVTWTLADIGAAAVNQTMYIGTTQVAINRPSGAIVLTGITSIDGNAATADKVNHILTRGSYLTGDNFDGSAAATWAVDADSANTPNKVVVRDADGDFAARVISGERVYGDEGVYAGGIGDLGESFSSGYNNIEYVDEAGVVVDYVSNIESNTSSLKVYRNKLNTNLSQFVDDLGINPTHSHSQYILTSAKGQAYGVAPLDENTKLPAAYLYDYFLGQVLYGGGLGANALATLTSLAKSKLDITDATITLTNDTNNITGYIANEGIYYIVTAAQTFAGISFEVGDWCISNGTAWTKVDNTDAVTGIKGDSESVYRIGNVNITKANIGLGNVADGAQVNVLEGVKLNGTDLTITSKVVNVNACTSIGVPTGLSVAALTTGGVITLSYASGYAIPTIQSITDINTNISNHDACIGALSGLVLSLQSKNQFDEIYAEYGHIRTLSSDLLVGIGSLDAIGDIRTSERIYGAKGVFSGGIGDLAESGSSGYNQILLKGSGNAVTSISDNGGSTLFYNRDKTFSESGHTHNDLYYTEAEIANILGSYTLSSALTSHENLTTTAHGLGASAFHADNYFALAGHNHSGVYQPLDADLTAIAGLTGTSGFLKKTAANTWSLDTNAYLTGITKAQVEAVLTGAITSHTHNYQAPLTGTGFVKSTAGVISYDTNTYLTTHQTIYGLTIQKNGTTIDTYAPNSAAKTINISDVASASSLSTLDANIDACIGALAGQVIALQSKNQFDELFAEYINARTISSELFIGALAGNASTATKLASPVSLWGNPFDGSASINGGIDSIGDIHTTQRIYGDSGVFAGGIGDLAEFLSSGYNLISTTGSGNAVTSVDDNGSTLNIHKDIIFAVASDVANSLATKVDKVAGYGLSQNNLTDELIQSINNSASASHTHSNKVIIDDITSVNLDNWDDAYTHSQITNGTNPHATTFANIANKPTTISGYGITDAYTKTEINTNYVPYTGANADVNLGTHTLTSKANIITGNVANNDIFTLQNTAAGSATYTRMQYIGTGRTWITGVGNLLESSLGVADKFYIYDNNASAIRMMIDTSGNTTFGGKIIKSGGTTSQFLKANGDIDETAYATAANLTTLDNNTDACIGALAGQVTDALIKNQFDEIYAEYGHIRTLSSDLFVGYLKGNADSATKLYTARNLWGQSFDGSAEIKDKMLQYCTGLGYSTTRQIELSSGKVELKDALTATSATFSGKVHTTNQVVGDSGVWAGGIGDLTDSEWTTATLSNGTQGTTYGTVRYRKIGGNAQIDGSFVYTWNGTSTPIVFTLPTSCCPIHNMTGWLYNNSNGIWRYVVGTDGKVTLIVIKSIVDGSNITSATTCIFNNMIFPIN